MLEQFFSRPAAIRRLMDGFLGSHLDSFAEVLAEQGYPRATIRHHLWLLADLGKWMASKALAVDELSEAVLDRFLVHRKQRRQQNHLRRGEASTGRRFLEHLRSKGVVAPSDVPPRDSPLEALHDRYEEYLRKERGVAAETVTRYWPYIHRFLAECLDSCSIRIAALTPDHLTRFLLGHVGSMKPKTAKLMVCALRSFFRFLYQRGEINTDLAAATPTVPNWRAADIPRYLEAEDVERVLDACDPATPVGRRDRAVLLVLARLGLRGSEVLGLELDDVNWSAGELTVRGKGRIQNRLPLSEEVGRALVDYLREDRPRCQTRRIFIRMRAPHRGFAHPSTVSTIVRRAVERAGLEPAVKGAHLLRHSLATAMIRRGASMAEIGEILRHRSPTTTEIYAKVDFNGLRSLAQPWPACGGEE